MNEKILEPNKAGEIILIDKPKGITSYDVIRRLQPKFPGQKIGHAGTLDPAATGLLIVAVGKKTKELATFLGLPKTYEAEILLGTRTDTADLDGKIIESFPVPKISAEEMKAALGSLVGILDIAAPLYSALKKNVRPLYSYARKGIPVLPPVKKMKVVGVNFFGFDGKTIKAEFEVGSGTYIRSLAEELGRRLGTVATLANLRRTRIGGFSVVSALKV